MENNKIEIIYRILINGLELTDETLTEYGLTKEEIILLTNKKIIEYSKNNTYKLVNIDKFRRYGVKLLLEYKIREANVCFKKCYELVPNGKDICLQFLLATIKKQDYQETFKIFSNLEKINPEKNAVNNNLYLYLLSFITECPKEYYQKVRNLQKDELMLPMVVGNKVENEIREAIVRSKFTYAYQKINRLISRKEQYSVKFELIRALLIRVIETERKHKANLLGLAKMKQYSEIISILNERQELRNLSNLEIYILLICEAIRNILQTKTIPNPTIDGTDDMYEALIGNNFKLALDINKKFNERAKENRENDIIDILLLDLNKLILDLQLSNVNKKKNKESIGMSSSESLVLNSEIVALQYTSVMAQQELTNDILEAEGFAYYIKSENMSLEYAVKKLGLKSEIILFVKLIYARDYYIESKYFEGDKLLNEVEITRNKSGKVLYFLDKVKEYRDSYKEKDSKSKKLIKK